MKKILSGLLLTISLFGCSSKPTPVAPVIDEFEPEKYLGQWYEILRLPHRFEEGLESISAEYQLNSDQTLSVTNLGYNIAKEKWEEATGHAKPVGLAMYRVTFFWPFYGGYYISWLALNNQDEYQVSIVTSDSHDYFWLLARTPEISEEIIAEVLEKAKQWGFDTNRMIRVNHSVGHQ